MSDDKRSTMQYTPVTGPVRTLLARPHRVEVAVQTKAKLSVWEGEGGAAEAPVPAVPLHVLRD